MNEKPTSDWARKKAYALGSDERIWAQRSVLPNNMLAIFANHIDKIRDELIERVKTIVDDPITKRHIETIREE